ncbi:MAG: thiamine pyrophosphate-dependent enzyme [Opitutaceae bacterium]|nr:thiamine pyrophosphate-dependent enzyme [Opitutaceae bacterium]
MMTKDEVFAPLARVRGDAVVVTTMGAVRPWARHSSSALDFASADSAMGHAADLALGLALARPERKVICLNGDGSMLMSLGTLVTIVAAGVRNLVLFVLENRTYEITGNQPVPGAGAVDFAALARGAGFRRVYAFAEANDYAGHVAEVLQGEGPVLVVAAVAPGDDGPLRRGATESERYLRPSLAESAHQMRRELEKT